MALQSSRFSFLVFNPCRLPIARLSSSPVFVKQKRCARHDQNVCHVEHSRMKRSNSKEDKIRHETLSRNAVDQGCLFRHDQISAKPTKDQRSTRVWTKYPNNPSKIAPVVMVKSDTRNGSGNESPRPRKEPGFSVTRNSPKPPDNLTEPI